MRKRVQTSLDDFINEELQTIEVDSTQFKNPHPKDNSFFMKGKKDGDLQDDVVWTRKLNIPAKSLKPSQDAVYLAKALGMAIVGIEGGDLGTIISKDYRILDGHHRWASTIFNNPGAKVTGIQADLEIADLIPVLRAAGDALGNKRGTEPSGGDINIFKASIEDIRECVLEGKYMDMKYYNKEKAHAWYEKIGETRLMERLNMIQRFLPPADAPPRKEMPKIEPEDVSKVSKALSGGKLDVRAPYAN